MSYLDVEEAAFSMTCVYCFFCVLYRNIYIYSVSNTDIRQYFIMQLALLDYILIEVGL